MKKLLFFAACAFMLSCNDEKKSATVSTDADTTKVTTADNAADATPAPPMDSAAMMKAWQVYMTPGAEHKMLAMSAGKWDEELTMYMSPDAPPQSMKATAENTMMLNGLYQRSVHKGSYNGMPFEGISTVGFNNASKKFQSSWVDNMGTGIGYMEGTYDSTTRTLTMAGKATDPMSGKEMSTRETMKFIDNDNQYMEMFDTHAGKEMRVMTIKFTRRK